VILRLEAHSVDFLVQLEQSLLVVATEHRVSFRILFHGESTKLLVANINDLPEFVAQSLVVLCFRLSRRQLCFQVHRFKVQF